MVYISCCNPSNAKYSHCIGTSTVSEAVKALTVIIFKEGGQSIIIKSYCSFYIVYFFF